MRDLLGKSGARRQQVLAEADTCASTERPLTWKVPDAHGVYHLPEAYRAPESMGSAISDEEARDGRWRANIHHPLPKGPKWTPV